MNHLVNISIAPVIVILDDQANPIQLFALPASFVIWLPCRLYAWLVAALLWLNTQPVRISDYCRSWAADLSLMAEATRLLLVGRWVFWSV